MSAFFISCGERQTEQEKAPDLKPQKEENVIHLSTSADPKIISKHITTLEKAYDKIGYKIKVHKLPAKRSIYESNNGEIVDGEVVRAAHIKEMLPGQIKVPVLLDKSPVSAFSTNPDLKINGWNSLKGLKVSSVAGFWHFHNQLKDISTLHEVKDSNTALLSVKDGLSEVCVLIKHAGEKMLKDEKYKGIVVLEPAIEYIPVYHYLNKKHASLVPELAKALSEVTGNEIEN